MGFLNLRFTFGWCFVISIWIFPALGQRAFDLAERTTARPTALSGQEFHCHTGYPLAQCQQDILQLKKILTHYPIERLGSWTWVLVRSQDWTPISRRLKLNPDSPAFTALEPRETFLEEALFIHDPERTAYLVEEWNRSMPELLELAVSHELGHAFCESPNEAAADRFGQELRNGLFPSCQLSRKARKRTVVAGEAHPTKPDFSRAP